MFREPLLVSILVLITVSFSALTHATSQAYYRRRAALGVPWFERGKQELGNNHAAAAIDDFRTALYYDVHNWPYSMHLADALAPSGQARPGSQLLFESLADSPQQRTDQPAVSALGEKPPK